MFVDSRRKESRQVRAPGQFHTFMRTVEEEVVVLNVVSAPPTVLRPRCLCCSSGRKDVEIDTVDGDWSRKGTIFFHLFLSSSVHGELSSIHNGALNPPPLNPSRALELLVVLVEKHDSVLLVFNLFVTSCGLTDLKRFTFSCKGSGCNNASHSMKQPSSAKSKAAFARGQGSVVGINR
ncbi:hypothetical protein NL676_039348 [Syzygium grande]|nr:hypothetical protein NL676_039348 [Syzygium grande]